MTVLYANPYDITAAGFYFESPEDFSGSATKCRNSYGDPVEEYEIDFIDGEDIDAHLFQSLNVHQGNVAGFFRACETWDDDQKRRVIVALDKCGYTFDLMSGNPDDFDIEVYGGLTLHRLVDDFLNEGMFDCISSTLKPYLDYDRIAKDLLSEHGEAVIAGKLFVYRHK
jgi:hypothetical protein